MNYILDENDNPVCEPDILKWGAWFESANRHVDKTQIGEVYVSTVFLGIDHGFGIHGPPVLWETMIFGGEHHQYQERYTSLKSARIGHARAVALVRGES